MSKISNLLLFSLSVFSQNAQTVPDITTLPDRAPELRRTTSADVCLGSDTFIRVERAPGRAHMYNRSHPMPTPLPDKMEATTDGVHTTATRSTVSMVPLSSILDEFPDSIAETISRELEKLVN